VDEPIRSIDGHANKLSANILGELLGTGFLGTLNPREKFIGILRHTNGGPISNQEQETSI
jgi:hypothetical protein